MNITLPPDTEKLIQERVDRGEYQSPSELVNVAVHRFLDEPPSSSVADEKSLRERLAPLIGAFDSSQETPDPRYRSEFGDIVAEKLKRQGLDIP